MEFGWQPQCNVGFGSIMHKFHLAAALLFLLCLCDCNKGKDATPVASSIKHTRELRNKVQPIPEIFEIEPAKKASITTSQNSLIRIPAGTFKGGQKVKLKWIETATSAEAFSLGIPMYDSTGRLFRSDGMFKLDTNAQLAGKSAIKVSMPATVKRPMNVYAWVDGKWQYRGKNQLKPADPEGSDQSMRSFSGVEPNVLYNFDMPTDPEEQSCVTVIVPEKQQNLLLIATETDGRSFAEAAAENSDRVSMRFLAGINVHLELLGPGRLFWERAGYQMPAKREPGAISETCDKVTAEFRELPPQPSAIPTTPEEYQEKLKEIRKKFGRLTRITMKNGERYLGYFSHEGPKMRIETPNGTVQVRDVQKVTPLH